MAFRPTDDYEAPRPALARSTKSLNSRDGSKQLWLDAWADPVAGVRASSCCMHTCNLFGDGDWRLVVADADKKIKVWKGTQKVCEHALLDVPVAITSFYAADGSPPRLPTLAVAAGAHVFLFRGLRPHYKFTLPPKSSNVQEATIWQQLDASQLSASVAGQQLEQLRAGGVQLAARSLQLLSLSADAHAQQEFADNSAGQPPGSTSWVTCMEVIRQAADEPDAPSQLVLGTEDGRVLILNAAGSAVEKEVSLPAVPAFLATAGEVDAGYRVTVAARDGRLYNIKSGSCSRTVIQLDAQPVGVLRINKQIVVATMADALHCYTGKGVRQYSVCLPASPLALQLLAATPRSTKLVLVALANGELRMYRDKALVSVHSCSGGGSSPVVGLCAGRYAREDNSLIAVTAAGGLDIKILPRTTNIDAAAAGASGPLPEQEVPLDVPKKSRLYVEQVARERSGAVDMHRVFQRDLVRLRLATARAYVKVLTDGQGSAAATRAAAAQLSMHVLVQGLGPRFRLLVHLTNKGEDMATDLLLLAEEADGLFRLLTRHVAVPCLVPQLQYVFKVDVVALQRGLAGDVRLVLIKLGPGQTEPLMTATVRLPASEDAADA